MRFFLTCVVLAVGCVAGVIYLAPMIGSASPTDDTPGTKPAPVSRRPAGQGASKEDSPKGQSAEGNDDRKVAIFRPKQSAAGAQSILIPDGRILASETQNVPSERDGKLILLATPVAPWADVPKHLLLEETVLVLAVRISRAEWLAERDKHPATHLQPVEIPEDKISKRAAETIYYRQATSHDSMAPGTTILLPHKQRFRKLHDGDIVRKGDILGVINPEVAVVDVAIKQARVEAAAADVRASASMKEESKRRLASAERTPPGTISRDDIGTLRVQVDRYISEETSKRSGVVQSQKELAGTLATLNLYKITASIDGRVKTLFKNQGDAVKSLEPVLQIQSTNKLRVEAQMEVADAQALRKRLEMAQDYRAEAQRLIENARKKDANAAVPLAALQQLQAAAALVAIEVEASQPVPPRAELKGHMQEVTCVAVSKGRSPCIISGSLDHTVRVWRTQGGEKWEERDRLTHGAAVRALACTGPGAKANLLLTATAVGKGRLFDLDNLDKGEIDLESRHAGAINAVAFNADGTLAVTAGDDRYIRVWSPSTGKSMGWQAQAHQAAITSLAFTPQGQLLSAGRDRRLTLWNVKVDGERVTLEQADSQPGRSLDVPQLGVSPDGKQVLFDEGRELRVVTLEGKKIEGSLANSGNTSFATMALFSPDGQTVLTNGNGPGRVQLWRTPSAERRAAEVRQYLWANGTATSGAFAPEGDFAVTGTTDHCVLVWQMPGKDEGKVPLKGELTFVDSFTDTSLRRVTVRATFDNRKRTDPGGEIIPGGTATIVVPLR